MEFCNVTAIWCSWQMPQNWFCGRVEGGRWCVTWPFFFYFDSTTLTVDQVLTRHSCLQERFLVWVCSWLMMERKWNEHHHPPKSLSFCNQWSGSNGPGRMCSVRFWRRWKHRPRPRSSGKHSRSLWNNKNHGYPHINTAGHPATRLGRKASKLPR